MEIKNIVYKKISELFVDTNNPRISNPMDEDSSINYLIQENKKNMINLINNINENGFFDQNVLSVVKENEKLIVLDGNRRISAIKCLLNPDLISDEQFKLNLNRIRAQKINKEMELPCRIYDKRSDAKDFIKTQHTQGGAISKWSLMAQYYFLKSNDNENENISDAFKLFDKIFSKEENLKIKNFSTIERIINKPQVEILKKLNEDECKLVLKKIISDTGKKGVHNSRTLNDSDACTEYFNSLIRNSKNINVSPKDEMNKEYLDNKYLKTKEQSIEKDPYAFINFEHSNLKKSDEMYKSIYKYSKEIKKLSKNYKSHPIAVSLLSRSIFEIGLKYWLKRNNLWEELLLKNKNNSNNKQNYDPSIKKVICFIRNKIINSKRIIFEKNLDDNFKLYFGSDDINMKKKFDILVHCPERIDIDPDEFMIYTKDFFYRLVYFIFNHKEENEK